jgi:hypothetical protein
MVKRILTKISVAEKKGKQKGIVYRSPRIYLPTKLTDDSMFPFIGGQLIEVKVAGNKLVISPVRLRSSRGGRKWKSRGGRRS